MGTDQETKKLTRIARIFTKGLNHRWVRWTRILDRRQRGNEGRMGNSNGNGIGSVALARTKHSTLNIQRRRAEGANFGQDGRMGKIEKRACFWLETGGKWIRKQNGTAGCMAMTTKTTARTSRRISAAGVGDDAGFAVGAAVSVSKRPRQIEMNESLTRMPISLIDPETDDVGDQMLVAGLAEEFANPLIGNPSGRPLNCKARAI
jgi:hypothetical protein